MVSTKKGGTKSRKKARSAKDPESQPLEVGLTVRFNFGKEAKDSVTMIDDQRIPMVNSIFSSRDVLVRGFVKMLVKAGLTQPKVIEELMPATKLLRRSR